MTPAELHILGCSPPYVNPGGACSGYLVREGISILLDCGHGVAGRLHAVQPVDDLDAIILSHLHPDHFFDLVAIRNIVVNAGLSPIALYVPPKGTEVLENVSRALEQSRAYFWSAFEPRIYEPGRVIDVFGASLSAYRVPHTIEANAIRLDLDVGSIAYSGDMGYSVDVSPFFAGVDLLLIEVTEIEDELARERMHLTPEHVASVVEAARPQQTILTHYAGSHGPELLDRVRSLTSLSVSLAADGDVWAIRGTA